MFRSIVGQCPLRGHRPLRIRMPSRVVLAVSMGLVAATLTARPALAQPDDGRIRPPALSVTGPGESEIRAAQPDRARRPRSSALSWLGNTAGGTHSAGPDGKWSVAAGLALALAICGGIAVAARRLGPRPSAAVVQVVGRVNLSPKHSVYLLRVGRRTLVVGAGPQGPPALITELDDIPPDPPTPQQEAES
jgi:flagellar biogenesis protein FliO